MSRQAEKPILGDWRVFANFSLNGAFGKRLQYQVLVEPVPVLGVLPAGSVLRAQVATIFAIGAPVTGAGGLRSPVRKNPPRHLLEEPIKLSDKY